MTLVIKKKSYKRVTTLTLSNLLLLYKDALNIKSLTNPNLVTAYMILELVRTN